MSAKDSAMRRKYVYAVVPLLSLLTSVLNAQDWKKHYEQAVVAYQSQQYTAALSAAEIACSNAFDKVSKAYSLQLVTAASLETGQHDNGLKRIDEEVNLFLEIEGPSSKNYVEALKKQVAFFELSNDVPTALQKSKILVSAVQNVFGSDHLEFSKALLRQGMLMSRSSAYAEARLVFQTCIEKLRDDPDAVEYYLTALYQCGLTEFELKEGNEAQTKFQEYVRLARTSQLHDTEEYQQVEALLRNGTSSIVPVMSTSASNELLLHYLKQGIQLHEQMELDSAIMKYSSCEEIIERDNLESKTAFSLYLNYASAAIAKEALTIAESKVAKAKALANKLLMTHGYEFGLLNKTEGDIFLLKGRNQEAVDRYLQALKLFTDLSPQVKGTYAKNMAAKLLNSNAHASARKVLSWLDQHTLDALSSDDQTDITLLYVTSLDGHEDSLAVAYLSAQLAKTSTPENKAKLRVMLATFYGQRGDEVNAVKLLQEVRQQGISKKVKADAAFHLARIQQRLGQFKEAEKSYEAAIEGYRDAGNGFLEVLEEASNSFATFYLGLGNYDAAERLYADLLKHANPSSVFYGALSQNLAVVYEQTSRYQQAKALLEKTLKLDEQLLRTRHPDYAVTLQNLGVLYLKTGEPKKAESLLLQALEIARQNSGIESLSYASKLANLGTVYQEVGDLKKAKDCYEKALTIRRILMNEKHPDYVYNQYQLAVLLQRQKSLDAAYPLFKSVAEFYVDQIDEVFPALSEIEKNAFYNKVSEVINAYQDFAIEYGKYKQDILSELYDFRLATKAILLNSMTTMRHGIIRSGDSDLLAKFSEWQHLKAEIAKRYTSEPSEMPPTATGEATLQGKANALEKYLSSQSALFADCRNHKKITWQQVKASLKPGEAAIEMIRLRLNQKNDSIVYAALVLQHGVSNPHMIVYHNGRALEGREFTMYKNCILYQIENTRSHSIYWKPLESELAGVHTVYFSPDGVFNKLNLVTLFDTETRKFLIDRLDVKLVSNTREVLNQSLPLKEPAYASLFGYPDFGAIEKKVEPISVPHLRALVGDENTHEIPELPGTQHEVNEIRDLLEKNKWQVKLFMREKATEENIKQEHSPTVLHIATHGFFIESPDRDANYIYSEQITDFERTPLLRSGLLLAGAEESLARKGESIALEDGVLTALEAMNLSLDSTALVVLSACETASGHIKNGEGVFGLQRAFLVSGAQSVMMSLWKVDDRATQELMTTFYAGWLASHNKHAALRETQLKIREKYPEPYYWGSFIMIGH